MNVAYLMHGIFFGGATRSLFLLLKSISNLPIKKKIYTISCNSNEILKQLLELVDSVETIKIQTIQTNAAVHTNFLKWQSNRLFKTGINILVEKLLADKIDILHINTTVFPHIYKDIKMKTNVKIITHVREDLLAGNGYKRLKDYMIGEIKQYSDAIICISNNESVPFINHNKLVVLPNPFNFSLLNKNFPSFREQNSLGNLVLVGMFSHFSYMKGHIEFLKALNILKEKNLENSFLFLIVGVKEKTRLWKRIIKNVLLISDYRSVVEKYIEENNLGDSLLLIPYTNDVFPILKELDILVRPAISGDPWGRDIIEGMAMKKPIVATGRSEFFVKDSSTGYLVFPKDPEKLAEMIANLINNAQLRDSFGENGFKRIRVMCDITKYGAKISELYESL